MARRSACTFRFSKPLAWIGLALALTPACSRATAPAPAQTPMPDEASKQLHSLAYVSGSESTPTARDKQRAHGGSSAPLAAQGSEGRSALFTRKLIRTAKLSIEVPRFNEAARAAGRIAEENGGYVADSQSTRNDRDRQHGSLTLRIPAERFSTTIEALKGLGRVRQENVSTEDISKTYWDLETRLRVKRETEARLRDILKTRTAKLSDVLEAERELGRVVEEIEKMEGERRFYDQQIALSTISVELHEPEPAVTSSALNPLREALAESLSVLATSVAVIIYVIVFAAPWALLAWITYRLVRTTRRRRKSIPAS